MISTFEEGAATKSATTSAPAQPGEANLIVFDIETGPAPLDEIEAHLPEIEAPGNYKDPEKIAAYKAERKFQLIEKAALSPVTGRVLAIGAWVDGEYRSFIGDETTEAECIRWFFNQISVRTLLVGFNSNSFDLPFLFRRAWALGITVPFGRLEPGFRISARSNLDLMDLWRLGDRTLFISLDAVSKYLGTGQKNGEGELFYKVLKAFPEEAAAYLESDVKLTFDAAQRMCAISPDLTWPSFTSAAEPEPKAAAVADADDY